MHLALEERPPLQCGVWQRCPLEVAKWLPLVLAVSWVFGPALRIETQLWWQYPDQAHCMFVPTFAIILAWLRRGMIAGEDAPGSRWGLVLLVLAAALQWAAASFALFYLHCLSLVPCLAGLVLFLGGWRALRWIGPSIGFLVFMFHVPGPIVTLLSYPLQRLAAVLSTFVLQLFGIAAFSQGAVIVLHDSKVGVAEACSGIRILFTCFALCLAVGLLSERRFWQRLVIVVSALPIAIIVNASRITATAIFHVTVRRDLADGILHDMAGWCMPLLAVAMVYLELALLSWLTARPVAHDENRT
jgi:exosortase